MYKRRQFKLNTISRDVKGPLRSGLVIQSVLSEKAYAKATRVCVT